MWVIEKVFWEEDGRAKRHFRISDLSWGKWGPNLSNTTGTFCPYILSVCAKEVGNWKNRLPESSLVEMSGSRFFFPISKLPEFRCFLSWWCKPHTICVTCRIHTTEIPQKQQVIISGQFFQPWFQISSLLKKSAGRVW